MWISRAAGDRYSGSLIARVGLPADHLAHGPSPGRFLFVRHSVVEVGV